MIKFTKHCFTQRRTNVKNVLYFNELHDNKKEEARIEKAKDKNEQAFVFSVDLQTVLLAPKLNVSTMYYRTKLQVYNFCFHNSKTNEGYCFL